MYIFLLQKINMSSSRPKKSIAPHLFDTIDGIKCSPTFDKFYLDFGWYMLVYHWKDGRFIIQHNTRHIYIRTLNVDKIENNQCVINVEITHNSNIFDCHSVCTVEKYEFIVDAKLNKVSEQKWA